MASQNKIITALTTNKNKPRVNIVTGKVNSTNIGFTKILSNPKTTATKTAVIKLTTCTPDMKLAISKTKAEVIKILTSKFISFFISKIGIIIRKTKRLIRKIVLDFRHEANGLHWEWFR